MSAVKCGNCRREDGTEYVPAYQLATGTVTGDYLVCASCLPIEQKAIQRQFLPLSGRPSIDGQCPNCEGTGKYFYSGGAVGICYSCNGNGKEKETTK